MDLQVTFYDNEWYFNCSNVVCESIHREGNTVTLIGWSNVGSIYFGPGNYSVTLVDSNMDSMYKEKDMNYAAHAKMIDDMFNSMCNPPIKLDCSNTIPWPSAKVPTPIKENTMRNRYNDLDIGVETMDKEARAEQHLQNRLYSVLNTKDQEARKTFGLTNDERPSSPNELIKRIQDGKFVLSKETEDKRTYDPLDYIKWRDPSVKEDKEGFKAYNEVLMKEKTKVEDIIMVGTAQEALAALNAFESTTIN